MLEYEHSFQINDWQPSIDYCTQNGYKLVEDTKQTRTIYCNSTKINARITVNECNEKCTKFLDFKQNTLNIKKYRGKKESLELPFENDEVIDSILEILKYKKSNVVRRHRKTFEKAGLKFEIDHYFDPYDKFVVAIEGDKKLVEETFSKVKNSLGFIES